MTSTQAGRDLDTKIPPIDVSAPSKTETATFALGCFWGPDSLFGCTKGVVRTRVGYSGGTLDNPTYDNLGDHIETVQIDYDPEKTSYEKLLWVFWGGHSPQDKAWKRQYMSAVFFHNDEQKRLAYEIRDRMAAKLKCEVHTEIVPHWKFYIAEDYHQKYHLQGESKLMEEFRLIYPAMEDFIASTAAARVNGYIGGYGTIGSLETEVSSFGLSPEGIKRLGDIVYGSKRYNPVWF
jgi:methionine-S-sulfoxide reductase